MRHETGTFELRELSSAELDMVCGGEAYVTADLIGDGTATGSYLLDNIPGVSATAAISGTLVAFGTPTLTLTAVAINNGL